VASVTNTGAKHPPPDGVGSGGEPSAAVPPGRAAGRPRSADADEAILSAARELLAERGWDGMSLGDVAARAGVAKTTLYRRWPGKAELVVDAMARLFDTLCPVDAGSVRADAEATIRDLVALLARPETQTAFLALAAHASRVPALRTAVREKIVDRQRHLVHAGIARAAARGEASQISDPELFFDVIAGTMVHRVLIAGEPVDEGYLARFLDLLVPGPAH
jgi:AcrR family transcriptional regulator